MAGVIRKSVCSVACIALAFAQEHGSLMQAVVTSEGGVTVVEQTSMLIETDLSASLKFVAARAYNELWTRTQPLKDNAQRVCKRVLSKKRARQLGLNNLEWASFKDCCSICVVASDKQNGFACKKDTAKAACKREISECLEECKPSLTQQQCEGFNADPKSTFEVDCSEDSNFTMGDLKRLSGVIHRDQPSPGILLALRRDHEEGAKQQGTQQEVSSNSSSTACNFDFTWGPSGFDITGDAFGSYELLEAAKICEMDTDCLGLTHRNYRNMSSSYKPNPPDMQSDGWEPRFGTKWTQTYKGKHVRSYRCDRPQDNSEATTTTTTTSIGGRCWWGGEMPGRTPQSCLGDCQAIASLRLALDACDAESSCLSVTMDSSGKYFLRNGDWSLDSTMTSWKCVNKHNGNAWSLPRRRAFNPNVQSRRRRSDQDVLSKMAPVRVGRSWASKRCVMYSEPLKCTRDAAGPDFEVSSRKHGNRTKVCVKSKSRKAWPNDALEFRCEATVTVPDEFDPRKDKWSECSEVFNHVRDQGRCGTCWAFAAAYSLDGRLCIQDRRFQGSNSYISAGYIGGCSAGRHSGNGCSGGQSDEAMQWVGEWGAPTGFTTRLGCTPYFAAGDAMVHSDDRAPNSPACPDECENAAWPRSLAEDLFRPSSFTSVIQTDDWRLAKEALYRSGPIAIYMCATGKFKKYRSGVVTSGCGSGNHATGALGYGVEDGREYILAMNSWGASFGSPSDPGMYKISPSSVPTFLIPFDAAWEEELPLPLPPKRDYVWTPRRRRRGSQPPIAPTAVPGTAGKPWTMLNGTCALHEDGCVESTHFPKAYGESEHCVFDAGSEAHPISVFDFDTEHFYDYLQINDHNYSGDDTIPQQLLVSGIVTWSTDGSISGKGWKICPSRAAN